MSLSDHPAHDYRHCTEAGEHSATSRHSRAQCPVEVQHDDQCGEEIRYTGTCRHTPLSERVTFPVHVEVPATTHDSGRLVAYETADGGHHVERVSTSLADLLLAYGIAHDPVITTDSLRYTTIESVEED